MSVVRRADYSAASEEGSSELGMGGGGRLALQCVPFGLNFFDTVYMHMIVAYYMKNKF